MASLSSVAETPKRIWENSAEGCYVALTDDYLDIKSTMDRVRDPGAGAIVLFAGRLSLDSFSFPFYT
jgi:hypothetical protein